MSIGLSTIEASPSTDRKPAITRLWIALQKLGRLRDTYMRDQTAVGRHAAARAMAELGEEVRSLTTDVLTETERTDDLFPLPEAG